MTKCADFFFTVSGCFQGEVDSRYADDKVNFVAFLWELRLAFNQKQEEFPDMCRLSLSIAVSANERIVDAGEQSFLMARLSNIRFFNHIHKMIIPRLKLYNYGLTCLL